MAPPKRPWFRFYVEAIYDRKLRRLQPGQRWLWVVILAAARQSKQPGVLVGVDVTDLADMAAMPAKDIAKAMPLFVAAEMIELCDDGWWMVSNWNERQFESDSSLLRVAKHRYNGVTVTPPDTETEYRYRKTPPSTQHLLTSDSPHASEEAENL